ncbi:MAG TPA: hypothetical protein VEX67_06035 [Solirubrobacteraceae bacterium]|nr:hypothetical protein [Solirubrobacteraceae bacterium]
MRNSSSASSRRRSASSATSERTAARRCAFRLGGGQLALGGSARLGEDPVCLLARLLHDRCRARLGDADDLRGGRFGTRLLEQLRPLPLGVRADRRGLLSGLGERLTGGPRLGVGAAPGALERRLGLQPRSVDVVRLRGLSGRHGSLALVELRPLVGERPSDVRAREPLAHELEMAVDVIGVIAAPHPAEGPLDDEHRQRPSSRRHEAQFRSLDQMCRRV